MFVSTDFSLENAVALAQDWNSHGAKVFPSSFASPAALDAFVGHLDAHAAPRIVEIFGTAFRVPRAQDGTAIFSKMDQYGAFLHEQYHQRFSKDV